MQRKKQSKFSYQHPLIKQLNTLNQDHLLFPPPAYLPCHSSNHHQLTHKLIKSTHLSTTQPFSLLIHPLHPQGKVHELQKQQIGKCDRCGTYYNPFMQLTSICDGLCKVCENRVLIEDNQALKYEAVSLMQGKGKRVRKMIMMIQGSEHVYGKQIHKSIIDCLKALQGSTKQCKYDEQTQTQENQYDEGQEDGYEIGFMVYNNEHIHIIDTQLNKVMKVSACQDMQLCQEQLCMRNLGMINLDQVQEVLQYLLYESYQIKSMPLNNIIEFVSNLYPKYQIQTKWFMMTVNNDCTHIHSVRSSKQNSKLHSSMHFFCILASYKQNKFVQQYGKCIARVYSIRLFNNFTLYYDLYHNLTQQTHYDVTINLKTTKGLSTVKSINYHQLNTNTTIPIDISTNKHSHHGHQFIQIQCILNQNKQIIINYHIPHHPNSADIINKQVVEDINGQVYFYVLMRKCLAMKQGVGRREFINTIKQYVNVDNSNELLIPQNMIDLFMYAFLIKDDYFNHKLPHYQYQKHMFLNEGLQTVVKRLYPKVYKIVEDRNNGRWQFRNIKFESSKFETCDLWFVDNGRVLAVVIGEDCPEEFVHSIFGNRPIETILQLTQIVQAYDHQCKQLVFNKLAIELVEKLRSFNQLYYLGLRVMKHDSAEFQIQYGRHMYSANNHKKFFKHLLMLK